MQDGKTVFRKAYGMDDTAAKQAMSAGMILCLGSITKQFTAVAILMLAEEGKLLLTDDITRFFPDYPPGGFDARVGRYELAPSFVLALSREGDRYYAQASRQPKLEIFPASETAFFSRDVEAEVRFDGADSGSLVLHQNG